MRLHTYNQATTKASRQVRSGFSLLEILVVVAIIVMLAGVGGYYAFQRYEDAQMKMARVGTTKVKGFVESYMALNGDQEPTYEKLVQARIAKEDELRDPWGQPYQITMDNDVIVVFTERKGRRISSADPAQ